MSGWIMKTKMWKTTPRWRQWRYRAKVWLKMRGYPWIVTYKQHNAMANEIRHAVQKQGLIEVAQERSRVEELMATLYKLDITGQEGPNAIQVNVGVRIDRMNLYHAASTASMWEYFAECMAHQLCRELKTMNYVTVREEIHRSNYRREQVEPWGDRLPGPYTPRRLPRG